MRFSEKFRKIVLTVFLLVAGTGICSAALVNQVAVNEIETVDVISTWDVPERTDGFLWCMVSFRDGVVRDWAETTAEEAESGIRINGLDSSDTYLIVAKNKYNGTYSGPGYIMYPERNENTLYFYGTGYFAFGRGQLAELTEKALDEAEKIFTAKY